MTDSQGQSPAPVKALDPVATLASTISLPPELETLPPETKSSMLTFMMALIVRQTSGPDPETSKIVAQSEMHEETCHLEGYKESLKTKDKQGERDHDFRKKRLNHATILSLVVSGTCIGGIACGLYLLIVRKEETLGSGLLIASFMALLNGGKSILQKDKD